MNLAQVIRPALGERKSDPARKKKVRPWKSCRARQEHPPPQPQSFVGTKGKLPPMPEFSSVKKGFSIFRTNAKHRPQRKAALSGIAGSHPKLYKETRTPRLLTHAEREKGGSWPLAVKTISNQRKRGGKEKSPPNTTT